MRKIDFLRAATSRSDLARLLGFSPSSLSYILYKMDDKDKYNYFSIPKKSGGERKICAPTPKLKLLQRRLADFLQDCQDEVYGDVLPLKHVSHGFRRGHSIFSNAVRHKGKKYVYNIDLYDFFGSFNFGRVRGFFIKDKNFGLSEQVATVIAQIACHDNCLPQGSPCSPIITNLIFHIIDIRISKLAGKNLCVYTRYADDLTFSTNSNLFPEDIARPGFEVFDSWRPGIKLEKEIKKAGFSINDSKVRMQYPGSRMGVTGLSVNHRVNTKREYREKTKAMVHRLLRGEDVVIEKKYRVDDKDERGAVKSKLAGRLAHIHYVDKMQERYINSEHQSSDIKQTPLKGRDRVYRDFLFFFNFVDQSTPTVICEGDTDYVYLKCAIQSIGGRFEFLSGDNGFPLGFLKYTETTSKVMHMAGGSDDICGFIGNYIKFIARTSLLGLAQPVIIVLDNDKGARNVFSRVAQKDILGERIDGSKDFYRLKHNLYLVVIPKVGNSDTCIEDFFDEKTRRIKVGGKSFSARNEYDSNSFYGKRTFSRLIVEKKDSVEFGGFDGILRRIDSAIYDYKNINSD